MNCDCGKTHEVRKDKSADDILQNHIVERNKVVGL